MTKAGKRAKIKTARATQLMNRRVNRDIDKLINELNKVKATNEQLKQELEDTRKSLEATRNQLKRANSKSAYKTAFKNITIKIATKMGKIKQDESITTSSGPLRVYHSLIELLLESGVDSTEAMSIAAPILSLEPWRVTAIPYQNGTEDIYIYRKRSLEPLNREEAIQYVEDFINRAATLRRRRYGEYHN